MSYTIVEDITACGTNLDEIPCEDIYVYYELYTIDEEWCN